MFTDSPNIAWHMAHVFGKATSLPVPNPGPLIPSIRLHATFKPHQDRTHSDNFGTSPSDIFVVRCQPGPAGGLASQSSPGRRCCNGSGFFRCPICDNMTGREQTGCKHFDCTCRHLSSKSYLHHLLRRLTIRSIVTMMILMVMVMKT